MAEIKINIPELDRMTYNGVDLTLDMFDRDTLKKVNAAGRAFQNTTNAQIKNGQFKDAEQAVELSCNGVFKYFDDIFGEDTHKKMFGDEVNFRVVIEVYKAFAKYAKEQVNGIKDVMSVD